MTGVESVTSFVLQYCNKVNAWEVIKYLYENNVYVESFTDAYATESDASGVVFPVSLKTFKYGTSVSENQGNIISNFPDDVSGGNTLSLETLTIKGTNISNVGFLSGVTSLTTVDLRYNYISSIEGVTSALPNVTSLNLSYNNITSLYGIQYFTGLQTLNLSYNTSLGDTCSYGGTTYFNLQLLSDLRTNNQTLTSINLTGCTDLNTDSTNSYWTTLKGLSGLTVTGP